MFQRLAYVSFDRKSILVCVPGSAIVLMCCASVVFMCFMLAVRNTKADSLGECICQPRNSSSCTTNTASAPPSAISQPPLACFLPDAYSHAIFARTWVLLGDSFAAGATDGSSASWAQLLHSRMLALSPDIVLLNLASQGGTLTQQFSAAIAAAEVRASIAARAGVLLFVSYGSEQMDTGSLELQQLADEFEQLANQSQAFGLHVLLLQRPDPIAGGVRALPDVMQCPDALQHLNYPSLMSQLVHDVAYSSSARLLQSVAQRYGFAIARPDVLFSSRSLALSRSAADTFFQTCSIYNSNGHTNLAAMLWACMNINKQ